MSNDDEHHGHGPGKSSWELSLLFGVNFTAPVFYPGWGQSKRRMLRMWRRAQTIKLDQLKTHAQEAATYTTSATSEAVPTRSRPNVL